MNNGRIPMEVPILGQQPAQARVLYHPLPIVGATIFASGPQQVTVVGGIHTMLYLAGQIAGNIAGEGDDPKAIAGRAMAIAEALVGEFNGRANAEGGQ
jgi:hypothetical protein